MTDSRTSKERADDERLGLRKYFVIQPCTVEGESDACSVRFKVDNQEFMVGPDYCEDRNQAEWYVSMLCVALQNLMDAVRPAPEPQASPYRDALATIRDRLRGDPADFETAIGNLSEVYTIANNTLFANNEPWPSQPLEDGHQSDYVDALREIAGNLGPLDTMAELMRKCARDALSCPPRPAPPPREWRPIESAPKDAEDILLARLYSDGSSQQALGYWSESAKDWVLCSLHGGNPTHWQALPSPPTKGEAP